MRERESEGGGENTRTRFLRARGCKHVRRDVTSLSALPSSSCFFRLVGRIFITWNIIS